MAKSTAAREPGFRSSTVIQAFFRRRFRTVQARLRMLERDHLRLEAGVGQQAEPVRAREQALDVPVPFDAHRSVGVSQQVRIVDHI